jgi:hypothetical protein
MKLPLIEELFFYSQSAFHIRFAYQRYRLSCEKYGWVRGCPTIDFDTKNFTSFLI